MPTMSEAKCFISCWQSASVCVHLNWQIRMWLSAVLCVLNLTDSCSFISLFRWHTKQTPAHSGTLQSCWSAYQQMWGCYLYLYMYSSSHVQCTHTSTNTPCTCTCCIIQCQFLSHPTACICMSYPLPLAFVGLLLDRQLTDSEVQCIFFVDLCICVIMLPVAMHYDYTFHIYMYIVHVYPKCYMKSLEIIMM